MSWPADSAANSCACSTSSAAAGAAASTSGAGVDAGGSPVCARTIEHNPNAIAKGNDIDFQALGSRTVRASPVRSGEKRFQHLTGLRETPSKVLALSSFSGDINPYALHDEHR